MPPHLYTATIVTLSGTGVTAIGREVMLGAMQMDTSFGLEIMQNVAGMISPRLLNLELALVGLLQNGR